MKKIFGFLFLMTAFIPLSVMAEPLNWVEADEMRARIIPGVTSIGPEMKDVDIALELELSKGWHTYWRVSGDSGLPPRFDWTQSDNIENIEIFYPAPKRKNESGLYTFGYDNHVTLPMRIALKEPSKAATLNLKAQILICKEICIPQNFEISAAFPAGKGEEHAMMPMVERARAALPPHYHEDLSIEMVMIGEDALVIRAYSKNGFENIDAFAVAAGTALTLPPKIIPDQEDPTLALIKIEKTPDIPALNTVLVEGKTLRLLLTRQDLAVEKLFQY